MKFTRNSTTQKYVRKKRIGTASTATLGTGILWSVLEVNRTTCGGITAEK